MNREVQGIRSLYGTCSVPSDKSILHRVLMISALAEGVSIINNAALSADINSTISCLKKLGIKIEKSNEVLRIYGEGLHCFKQPKDILNAGNSGTTIRLLSGILSGQNFSVSIDGDDSLRKRPMKRIIEPLSAMGANIHGSSNYMPPIFINGKFPLKPISYELPAPSAQVKSAILFAGIFADGITTVIENISTRNHTERLLGLSVIKKGNQSVISIEGGLKIAPKEYTIPGDPSSAAFLIVAGLITKESEILIKDICLNSTRIEFINVLKQLGAQIEILNIRNLDVESIGDILVRSSKLSGKIEISGNKSVSLIDEIPILAIAAAFSGDDFLLKDAKELRFKESDRIKSLVFNLKLMGLKIDEYPDGFAFKSEKKLYSNRFRSFGDHRIAMAMSVAGMGLENTSTIMDIECVDISYPLFWSTIDHLKKKK